MAAKLKKRALAEYQSQVTIEDSSENKDQPSKSNKKLKLLLPPRRTDSTSSSITSSTRRLSSCAGDSSIEGLMHQVVLLTPSILDGSLPVEEVKDLLKRLTSALSKSDDLDEADIRSQIYLSIGNIVKSYTGALVNVDFNEDWLSFSEYVIFINTCMIQGRREGSSKWVGKTDNHTLW